jgi:hypothetical protein
MKSNKLLTAVFVVLFIVLLGEVGYLLYSSRQSAAENQPAPVSGQVNVPTSSIERNGTQAIKDNVLNYIAVANEGVLKTATLISHFEGKIIELDNKIDDPSAENFKIRFQAENGSINGFIYNKNEVSQKLSVFRSLKDGQSDPITIDDLKVGDLISLDQNVNLLDDDLSTFVISIKITLMP